MAVKGGTTSEETKAKQSAASYRRYGVTEEDLRVRALTPKKPKGFQRGNQLGKANIGREREITPEWRENSRLGTLRRKERDGYINSPEARAKASATKTGFKHSEESRRNMSKAQKARGPRPPVPPEVGRKISASKMGKSNYKIKGAKCHLWKGGVYPEHKRIRSSLEYKTWRRAVFERDNFTCQFCGTRPGPGNPVVLNADHILPFSEYPDLRLDLNNGRTLCEPCHKTTPSYLRWKGKGRKAA